ncbi:MAG: CBS domain-containing protein [Actinomycetota bacterium]|nr:CBS domain-containing protein [Actinomycetota bacterium]
MTTAREIMNPGAECVQTDETAGQAARRMTELQVGALPICGPDKKIKGVVTDRDLVRKVFGSGRDGSFPAGDLNQSEAVTIGADDSAEDVLATMTNHKVRRLPVIDGSKLVGMISLADVARSLPNPEVGKLVEALSAD